MDMGFFSHTNGGSCHPNIRMEGHVTQAQYVFLALFTALQFWRTPLHCLPMFGHQSSMWGADSFGFVRPLLYPSRVVVSSVRY